MKKKYLIVDQDGEDWSESAFPVLWSRLPLEFIQDIPDFYLRTEYVVNKAGHLQKKTVVWLEEVESLDEDEVYIWETQKHIFALYDF